MFHDPDRFPILRALRRSTHVFQQELSSLGRDDFLPWPERRAYQGGWLLFPLFAAAPPPGFAVDYAEHRRRCPRSVDVLREHPRIFSAALSWLDPGARLLPHKDAPRAYNLRAQLGLRIEGPVSVRASSETRLQRNGELLLFDTRREYELVNHGDKPRVALVVDFEYSHDEEAGVIAEAEAEGLELDASGGYVWHRGW